MRKHTHAILMSIFAMVFAPQLANALPDCVFFADAAAAPGGDGQSWATAYDDLQQAIDAAEGKLVSYDRCEVWVTTDEHLVYVSARSDTLKMRSRVDVYGGFLGFETSKDERNSNSRTYLSGGPSYSDPTTRVYHVITAADDSVLDSFMIYNGLADGSSYEQYGGGVFVPAYTTPIISNTHFYHNNATRGGGLGSYRGKPVLKSCAFIYNGATSFGGAAYLYRSNGSMDATDFYGNYSSNDGGAVYQYGGNMDFTDTWFTYNSATDAGGGLFFNRVTSSDTILMSGGLLENNQAVRGGGVFNYPRNSVASASPKYIFRNLVFRDNTVTKWGAGIYNYFYNSLGTVLIENNLFHNNDSGYKGALYNHRNSSDSTSVGPEIVNCTFAENTSGSTTGGIRNWRVSATIVNSIFWNNEFVDIHDGGGAASTVRYSSLQTAWLGIGASNIVGDPMFINTSTENYRLTPESPCIDAADSNYSPLTDLDDMDREDITWKTNTGIGTMNYVDIGAYEYRRVLRRRDVADSDATCLAGGQADYYVRPGFGADADKWVIFLQGGGFCYDTASCEARDRYQVYPYDEDTLFLTIGDAARAGILSDEPSQNPKFYNFNQVYLHYCSSDVWVGGGADGMGGGEVTFIPDGDTTAVTGEHRGSAIFESVIQELRTPYIVEELGLPRITDASKVLLVGTSAGGFGTMSNLDRLAGLLPSGIDVRGFNDAGWLVNVNKPVVVSGIPTTVHNACDLEPPPAQYHYSYMTNTFVDAWNARVGMDEDCVTWVDGESGTDYGRCLYGDFLEDPANLFIGRPMYVHLSQLDTSGIGLAGLLDPLPADEAFCTDAYSTRVRDTFNTCVDDGFSEHVEQHGIAHKPQFLSTSIGGVSAYVHFSNWFEDIPQPSPLIE